MRITAARSLQYGDNAQTGMVLLLCLMFLTALTLLGLSAAANNVAQNQLITNLEETERAKHSTLAALAWAEQWLLELEGLPPESCPEPCDNLYIHAPGDLPPGPEFQDLSWWLDRGSEAGIDPVTGERIALLANGSADPPVWLIEELHQQPPAEDGSSDLKVWYRLLARGSGRTDSAIAVVESIVVRPWRSADYSDPQNDAEIYVGRTGVCAHMESDTICGRLSWQQLR